MTAFGDIEACLRRTIRSYGSVLVAASGGLDSSLVLAIAAAELPGRVTAVTATSPLFFEDELQRAKSLAKSLGVNHLEVPVDHLSMPAVADNPPDRCYHCKLAIFGGLRGIQERLGLAAMADGGNADDASDYRPGQRAAAELGVRSPLAECGAGKTAIRELTRRLGLPEPERPAMACLASRFPYGARITALAVEQVSRGEAVLRGLGLSQVRLRHHGDIARLEVDPAQLHLLVDARVRIVGALREIGYSYICADLAGYRQGSLNEILPGRRPPNGEAGPAARPAGGAGQ